MRQLRTFGLLIFVAVTIVACSGQDSGTELTEKQHNQVAERIAPDGQVAMAGQAVAGAVSDEGRSGESIYNGGCNACHSTGAGGAPKMGDVAVWADRLTKGIETVYANAINGIGGMPARGICMDCSDDEIIATVDYMLQNSQ